ncbi:chemotaxis protein CheA [Gallionella capsiferriformans]|uniref:Chemotaxis protein CheA n=1 Tax=Gallionella capsiferriformans (strain ES-2) TaxID=395494 RepID=D9SHI2_GALCS|nr:chemotaxis protein CheA [Gallionella capsiferriformans]ADL55979.1 CheA signal transduction histidine kinase [Gallionella capsiferriformans ES-2]
MDEIQQAFVVEGRELLQMMEENLLQMEERGSDPEIINAIFRAAHTIKGGAGVIECQFVVEFTHVLENVLDEMRAGNIVADQTLVEVLLICADQLGALLNCIENECQPGEDVNLTSAALREKLQHYLSKPAGKGDVALTEADVQVSGGGQMETDNWHISLRFGPDVLRKGMDPASFLRYLMELGEIVHLTTLPDAMPNAEEMDAESCYLGFEISYKSEAEKSQIENVFSFVSDDCVVHIWPPHSKLADFISTIETLPEDTMRLGEILILCGALTQNELDIALNTQSDRVDDRSVQPKIGDLLVNQGVVTAEVVEAAAVKQGKVADKKTIESQLIRVQAAKLDQLIDLVGEMVIASAGANMQARKSGETALVESTSVISMLVEQIRDSALQLRMVQIGETFTRFQRVVRDTSRELGKDIELVISGSDAELDKSVVEKLGDPLMHLVRNALDHGVESPDVRLARGKPARGTLKLNAYHESGGIAIEIIDDGGGMNRDKILNKARERELITANQVLTDSEIFGLIFEPGFSTADKITNISGRGVGLDVVKRNITALRGTIEVESREGEGSTFRIRLPLTLAIIDGFLVGVGRASYVIPLGTVVECIELSEKDRADTLTRQYINLRGEVLPFVRLREQFEISDGGGKRENIVVVQYAGQKIGLVVDELMGEFQTVIKPLGTIFKHIKGIGGSTILGSGEVALILDVQSLVALATVQQNRIQAA